MFWHGSGWAERYRKRLFLDLERHITKKNIPYNPVVLLLAKNLCLVGSRVLPKGPTPMTNGIEQLTARILYSIFKKISFSDPWLHGSWVHRSILHESTNKEKSTWDPHMCVTCLLSRTEHSSLRKLLLTKFWFQTLEIISYKNLESLLRTCIQNFVDKTALVVFQVISGWAGLGT